MQRAFDAIAQWTSRITGSAAAFVVATVAVIAWAASGSFFHFSDTWQLIVNTLSSIVTFLMVFLIQNAQDRNTLALQIKLDELIQATKAARTDVIGIEHHSQEELEEIRRARQISLANPGRVRGSDKR